MHFSHRLMTWLAAIGAALTLAACAQPGGYPASNYPGSYPGGQAYSQYGRVTNVEYVRGGQSQGVAGVIGGALIGNMLERNMDRSRVEHYRVTVQFDNGGMRQFEYAQPPNVQIGDRVRADGDQLYR